MQYLTKTKKYKIINIKKICMNFTICINNILLVDDLKDNLLSINQLFKLFRNVYSVSFKKEHV